MHREVRGTGDQSRRAVGGQGAQGHSILKHMMFAAHPDITKQMKVSRL